MLCGSYAMAAPVMEGHGSAKMGSRGHCYDARYDNPDAVDDHKIEPEVQRLWPRMNPSCRQQRATFLSPSQAYPVQPRGFARTDGLHVGLAHASTSIWHSLAPCMPVRCTMHPL